MLSCCYGPVHAANRIAGVVIYACPCIDLVTTALPARVFRAKRRQPREEPPSGLLVAIRNPYETRM